MGLPGRIGYKHDDRFKGLPLLKQPSEQYTKCQKCLGHGFWNIMFPGPGKLHLVQRCSSCNRRGWIGPDHQEIYEVNPKNWLYNPEERKFLQANARPSSIIGGALKIVRQKSKLPLNEFTKKLSEFLGESITSAILVDIEDGNMPLHDTLYIAVGQITNSVLTNFYMK